MNKFAVGISMLALSACATGATLQETQEGIGAIPSNMGRIAVYRTGVMGAAVQPPIMVDGAETGRCQPNGVFLVDVAPGQHALSAETEVRRDVAVPVTVGETTYVKCSIGIGFFVGHPQLDVVPAATGQAESANLAYIGHY